jgi:hypothetical protein
MSGVDVVVVVFAGLLLGCVWRIARALDKIAATIAAGVVSVRDVERAKVYSEHLGAKLKT